MRGLYLITNDDPIELLLAKLEGAMATYEVAVLQYRRKNVPQTQQAYEIEYMKSMCDQYKVPFVINDDLETAVKYGVGVHLGQEDGSIVEAVARLPQDVLIGRSCNNSIELAEQAIAVRERGPAAKPLSRQDPAARAARRATSRRSRLLPRPLPASPAPRSSGVTPGRRPGIANEHADHQR